MLTTGGGISGTIPDTAGGGIYVGSSPPSSALTNKVWYKTDGAGRPLGVFMFYNGNWRKVYTGAVYGEIRLYAGPASVFDGTGRGIIGGDLDGWALCNGQNATPNLHNYFICGSGNWDGTGWLANPAAVAGHSGGKATNTIQDNNLPALNAQAWGQGYSVQPGGSQIFSVGIENSGQILGGWPIIDINNNQHVGGQVPLDNTPPWAALAFIMFIGYA
jgi:hypothetical protein